MHERIPIKYIEQPLLHKLFRPRTTAPPLTPALPTTTPAPPTANASPRRVLCLSKLNWDPWLHWKGQSWDLWRYSSVTPGMCTRLPEGCGTRCVCEKKMFNNVWTVHNNKYGFSNLKTYCTYVFIKSSFNRIRIRSQS